MKPENFEKAKDLLLRLDELKKIIEYLDGNDTVCITNRRTNSMYYMSPANHDIAKNAVTRAFLIEKEIIEIHIGKLD